MEQRLRCNLQNVSHIRWLMDLPCKPAHSAHWLARKARLMSLPATRYMQEASMLAAYFQDCCAQKMLQRYMALMPQMPLSVCEFALHHLCDKRLTPRFLYCHKLWLQSSLSLVSCGQVWPCETSLSLEMAFKCILEHFLLLCGLELNRYLVF